MRHTESDATHVQVNRPLRSEFGQVLDSLDWNIALLQEAPPRWLDPLAAKCRAAGARVLTSRNELGRLRGALGDLNPDVIASNEGGSNMILVRGPARIEAVKRVRLATRPESRSMLMVRVTDPAGLSLAVACAHLSVGLTGQGPAELVDAAERAVEFAGGDPVLFGGDLNLRPAQAAGPFDQLARRFGFSAPTESQSIDHLLGCGLDAVDSPTSMPPSARELRADVHGRRLRLSDHTPVTGAFEVR